MRRLIGFVALLLLGACVGSPPEISAPPARDVYLRAAPDRIWDQLLVILTDAEMPVENMDRSYWFLRSQEMRVPAGQSGEYMDCGKDGMGTSYTDTHSGYVRVTVYLRPAGDSTGVRMVVSPRMIVTERSVWTARVPEVSCVSRGALERRLMSRLQVGSVIGG